MALNTKKCVKFVRGGQINYAKGEKMGRQTVKNYVQISRAIYTTCSLLLSSGSLDSTGLSA